MNKIDDHLSREERRLREELAKLDIRPRPVIEDKFWFTVGVAAFLAVAALIIILRSVGAI